MNGRFAWQLGVILPLATVAWAGEAEPVDTAQAEDASAVRQWLPGLAEGSKQALADRKPLLIRAGAAWCPVCRELMAEIEKPDVQKELADWTLVYVDVDRSPEDARRLGITGVPALRLQTVRGRLVAAKDGKMTGEELVAWLREHYEESKSAPDDELLAKEKPDLLTVVRLIRHFGDRDPPVRGAAIGRIAPYPNLAGGAVLKALREGSLATRLAALELLEQWRAPIEDIDPWQPQTITAERLAGLEEWLDQAAEQEDGEDTADADAALPPRELSEQELDDARQRIDRMLRATDAEASAIRDRLGRLGPSLLEEVGKLLKDADTDRDRERLRALRYRLVATDALVLRWPGGLARLASTDAAERQQAAEELAELASDNDQDLLLELFSDSDPLVREISLRGLQEIGGRQSTAALTKLLSDPEPNVRAAVLKQLEVEPQRKMVPKVAEYLKTETDPDLIVHAVRFLRTVGGSTAMRSMMGLLEHESWQVRAEAAAGLGKGDSSFSVHSGDFYGRDDVPDELQVDAYIALLDLLEDPDAFVVSRAVSGLADADLAVAIDPLARAAERHPDLATQIIEILAGGDEMREKAVPHLRRFASSENPIIRAAAIRGLVGAAPHAMRQELLAALEDQNEQVRIAAAEATFQLLEAIRRNAMTRVGVVSNELWYLFDDDPVGASLTINDSALQLLIEAAVSRDNKRTTEEEKARDADKVREPNDEEESVWDRWLLAFYGGTYRPQFLDETIESLEKMLQAEKLEERIPAALALVSLGRSDQALPVLEQAVQDQPARAAMACRTLPWLVWKERVRVFRQFHEQIESENVSSKLLASASEVSDLRMAETFWNLLADEEAFASAIAATENVLRTMYLGSEHWSSGDTPIKRHVGEATQAARQHIAKGSKWQRAVGLLLLLRAAPDEAEELVTPMVDDKSLDPHLRQAAFHVLLAAQTRREREATAIATLSHEEPWRRTKALACLAFGTSELSHVSFKDPDVRLEVGVRGYDQYASWNREAGPIVPDPPAGLSTDDVRSLMDNTDPVVAAHAGYLMALLGEPEGLHPLLRLWREGDGEWKLDCLVYRAIAMLNDPSQIQVLKEIYGRLDGYQMKDFYWTIRIMSGPEVLKFRKQIRDEVGMDQLN